MLDSLYKNPHDKVDKEEFEKIIKDIEAVAEESVDIKKSMAAIQLCISTVEDKEIICISHVILALMLAMPVSVLLGFQKSLPDLISQRINKDFINIIINNCKNQDESNE